MSQKRRRFTAQQKAEIVRRHIKDKISVASLAEELSIQPTLIYQWVTLLIDQADRLFEKSDASEKTSRRQEARLAELKEQQIQRLKHKITEKNEVIAELMEENIKAKKANGDL